MNAYKRFVFGSIALAFVLLAFLVLWLYLYDPLQIYHKPYYREISFSRDTRVQNRGIIKNYGFDSFILGTSMLENTSAKEASEKIGGKWVNVSMAGSSYKQRAIILNYIFKHVEAKHVLYSVDIFSYADNEDNSNFDFLYDNNDINDLKIYFNQRYITCALTLSSSVKCVGYKDLDTLINWAIRARHNQNFGGIQNWIPHLHLFPTTKKTIDTLKNMTDIHSYEIQPVDDEYMEKTKTYMRENILKFAKEHPQTQFHLVIPTYSRLHYRTTESLNFSKLKVGVKWLLSEGENLPNLKIYGFDDLNFADNVADYTDGTHYSPVMNSMQLDAVKNGTHILTKENYDDYFDRMEKAIRSYDLAPLIADIKAYEEGNKTK